MNSNFRKGLRKGLVFYATGFVVAWLIYVIFGWDYKHAPGLHLFVAFLFLFVGAGWTLFYFILLITGQKSKVNFGVLTIHIITIFSIVLYVYVDIRSEEVAEYKNDPTDIITISKDTSSNINSIVNGKGDTLYSKKGDSILINRIKSETTYKR